MDIARGPVVAAALTLVAIAGCGGRDQVVIAEKPAVTLIESRPVSPAPQRSTRWDRLKPNDGVYLTDVKLRIVSFADDATTSSVVDFVSWLFLSSAWQSLSEYGVSSGEVIAVESRAPTFAMMRSDVSVETLEARLLDETATSPTDVRDGRALLFILPEGVSINVGSTHGNGRLCRDLFGFHRFARGAPYAVIGGCERGRSEEVISHELAEMTTDPIIGRGWMSPEDASKSQGEIADLCRRLGPFAIGGKKIARYWSNQLGACSSD